MLVAKGLLFPAVLLALLFGGTPLSAQSMKQVLESLTPAKDSAAQLHKPTASEQLAWTAEQIQNARQNVDLVQSEGFKNKVASAGLPPSRVAEMHRDAVDALDLWVSAQNLLEWIVARESIANVPQEQLMVPGDITAALALETEYDEINNQISRLGFEASAHIATVARAEQQRRSAREDVAELKLEAEEPLQAAARDRSDAEILQATIRLNAAEAQIFIQRWLSYRHQLETTALQTQAAAIRKILDDSGYHRLLSASRATAQIAQVEQTLPSLEADEQKAAEAFELVSGQLSELRSRVDASTAKGEAPPAELQKQLQNALARFSQQETLRSVSQAHTTTLRHTASFWDRVLELVGNPALQNLQKAQEDLEGQQPNVTAMADRIDRLLAEKRLAGDRLRQDLRMPGLNQTEREALEQQIQTNQELTEKLLAVQNDVAALRALMNRLSKELDTEISALLAQKKWSAVLGKILKEAKAIWDFQITEQGNRLITLGTIVSAVFALIFAIVVARFTSHRISVTAEKRLKLGTSQAHLIEKLTLYVLSVLLILMILQWLHIPLTIFAFLGGALAVGIGFGSQNLINNFISGLLLLLERKINVGDLVEVDGNFGRVINLGSRCSAIRKFDGVEVLVPNSSLLEKNVINWTLSDPMHRYDFGVGVAYGSDVELVLRTLQEVLDAQPELVRDPAPEVAFEDFADSNLNFRVYYWLLVGVHNARHIGTDLRVRIDRLFKERNLEMAFPQRDVHLLSDKPLDVRLSKDS